MKREYERLKGMQTSKFAEVLQEEIDKIERGKMIEIIGTEGKGYSRMKITEEDRTTAREIMSMAKLYGATEAKFKIDQFSYAMDFGKEEDKAVVTKVVTIGGVTYILDNEVIDDKGEDRK